MPRATGVVAGGLDHNRNGANDKDTSASAKTSQSAPLVRDVGVATPECRNATPREGRLDCNLGTIAVKEEWRAINVGPGRRVLRKRQRPSGAGLLEVLI